MEYPWKQFATDYTDKGSNTNAFTPLSSHMCYQPSLQSSYPSYNRSPAPFYSTNPEPSNSQLNPPPRFKVNSFYKKQPLDLQQTSHGESQFITPEQVQEHSQYPQEQWQVGQTHKPEIQQQTSLRPFIQQFENYDHQPIQHQQPSQPITQQYENYCQQQPIQHQQSLQPVTQQYENYYQQQQQQYQQQQPETIVPGNFESGNRVIKNTREDPDIDEDFPSYADLRNVFLRKQRKAEAEQRIANFQKPKVVNKPPLVPQKPLQPVRKHTTAPPAMSPQHSFPQKAQHSFLQFNLSEPKALKPARDFTPTSSPSPNKREFGVGNDQSVKGKTLLNNTTYNGGMMEIPVHHMDDKKPTWHHIKLNRTGVRQRPLSLLEINSNNNYDSSTPRVVITSNSPLSPQKAIYRPDSDQPGDWFDRATPTAYSANTLPSRSSSYSKPRRRASYGEILITRNSPPRSVSLAPGGSIRRAVSQASHSETYPKEDVKYYSDERKYSTLGNYKKHEESFRQHRNTTSSYRSTQSTWSSSSDVGHRYPGTKIRNPTIDQMLYPSTTQNAHFRQRQRGGDWRQPAVVCGPQVVHTPSNTHPGKTGAHAQFNSPMALYSSQNAQKALEKDKEASELLQIVGPSKYGPAIKLSPTLQAVLKEEKVKHKTGHSPTINFYVRNLEYGPGIGPLRQYEEVPDSLSQEITNYNQKQDKFLSYSMWNSAS